MAEPVLKPGAGSPRISADGLPLFRSSFGERSPTAYETLLVDAMICDPTLYTRQDMVEASWRAVEPILENWASRKFDFPNYEPGTWGPSEADAMLARRGHQWRNG